MPEFNYNVVGARSAGSARAQRIALFSPQENILLLEVGDQNISPASHVPAAIMIGEKYADILTE